MSRIMNIISIDPSIIGTAVVVNEKIFTYVRKDKALNKAQTKLTKWFDICDDYVNYRFLEFDFPEEYSKNEIYKLNMYGTIIKTIIDDIKNSLAVGVPTYCIIEGYSYSSSVGPLIDLVNFSTQLRMKLLEFVDDLIIITPSQAKLKSAELTYEPTNIGKRVDKFVYLNSKGVKGGSFSKHDMYNAITDNDNIDTKWKHLLLEYHDILMEAKSVPKPIEDINDAVLFYNILKKIKETS